MGRFEIIIATSLLCILNLPPARAQSDNKAGAPTIVVTTLTITDKTLELNYQIRNDSEDDAWILVGHHVLGKYVLSADVFMTEDNHMLLIRKRLALEEYVAGPPSYGRYVRLRPGECQTEGIVMKMPFQTVSATGRPKRQERGLEYAGCVAIELGYYSGNLPEQISTMHDKLHGMLDMEVFSFNTWNEKVISRDDEILIPYMPWKYKGEQFLKAVVDDLRIPYVEERSGPVKKYPVLTQKHSDLSSCSRIEIQYHPSMLEYFFPYSGQQSLLSSEEKQHIQTENTLVIESDNQLKTIARDFGKQEFIGESLTFYFGELVRYRRKFDLICHYVQGPQMSFTVYNDNTLVRGGDRYLCYDGFPSLRIVTPRIHSISLRVQCGENLKHLWHRLRLYPRVEATRSGKPESASKKIYPTPTEWCDAMIRPFHPEMKDFPFPVTSKWDSKMHSCPSAGEGKSHYAINPNCGFDSAPETVLLFETTAGWNQHGGPGRFTFDNHDPKGGCILLNDGTVKFIRTQEELRRLRWE